MKTRLMLLVAAVALTGCQRGPTVEDAWVRLPAVPGRPAAAYAMVSGGSSQNALLSVATPAAQKVELHRSMTGHAGMAEMRPLERLTLPGGGATALAPEGTHIMLFGLSDKAQRGGTIPLTFRFEQAGPVTVNAKLIAAGDPAP